MPRDNHVVPAGPTNGSGGGNGNGHGANGTNGANGTPGYFIQMDHEALRRERIDKMGRLLADDGFIDDENYETFSETYARDGERLTLGVERLADLLCHTADVWYWCNRNRTDGTVRYLNAEELRQAYRAFYGTTPFRCDRHHFNRMCDECTHPEVERMMDEWFGRLTHHRSRDANWVRRRLDEGKRVHVVRTDPKLVLPVSKHRASTGNSEYDQAIKRISLNHDKKLSVLPTRLIAMLEQDENLLDLATYETRNEVAEKISLKGDVAQLQLQMAEVMKRLA